MKKSKKIHKVSKKIKIMPHKSWQNLALVVVLFGALLFTAGVLVWNYFPLQSTDIFVVHPLIATPVPTPFVPTDIIPVESTPLPTTAPVLEEEVPTDYPSNYDDATDADPYAMPSNETDITSTTPPAKPGFLQQSVLGWTIIMKAITAPFTK